MTSRRFFFEGFEADTYTVKLKGEEHHHLSCVIRAKKGKTVILFDKKGNEFKARVDEIRSDYTLLRIEKKVNSRKNHIDITLAQALLKAKKMDLVVQKATELGINHFVPVPAVRSVAKIEEKKDRKIERWNKIALSAAKQCGRTTVPEIAPCIKLKDLDEHYPANIKFFLHEKNGRPLKKALLEKKVNPSRCESVIVLVGPEGGWTNAEEKLILEKGYEPVGLGPRILRSETSAICCLAIIDHYWNT
ncbi:MAG: 16S rRNA (uracil(1498)-N(3))-methyltransferase [Candidatus Aminicenantes bacterium]|nr:16S rRNA (uracil(1498)-N(3))-methyltransferase [Candidatus Aminicenantes bacterium]